ncbi:MAG: acetyl-CoA acetyltransferase [Acidimicrobiales bacterium]|nr:acetyl-CoA acetyltransferase [Acidimicrobiales bacterium]
MIVGVGQLSRRVDDPAATPEPAAMMAEALARAADDSGAPSGVDLLKRADSILVPALVSWHYGDPGAAVAGHIGASPRQTVVSTVGGNSPQMLVAHAALAIGRGELDVALVCGAEAVATRWKARKVKAWLDWPQQDPSAEPSAVIGIERPANNDAEMSRGIALPTQVYPMFETAQRAASGRSVEEHQRFLGELWSRFSRVAATNPYAWSPIARTAEEITTVGPDNRMIGFPYPKLMNANIDTDQAAALIICSVAAAESAGVPRDRWVFPWSSAEAHDHWFVSERDELHRSPAIRLAGRAALDLVDRSIDDVGPVDLYSCFPSAVQIAAAELGLPIDDADRPLTVTGGLGFAGGPANNYVTHSLAAMTGALRADPGALGLVTAVGWYLTKHAVGLYATEPPLQPFRATSVQAAVDALPRRDVVTEWVGPVTVDAYTVMHERDGSPAVGLVMARLDDGRRACGTVHDAGAMRAMCAEEFVGRAATMAHDGELRFS